MNGVDLSPFGSHCQFDKYKIDAELSPEESVAVDYILQELQYRSLPFERIKLRRRSNSYLSLIIDDIHDFCRIKAGKKSTWCSCWGFVLPDNLKNDPRFEKTNKNLMHWKIQLNNLEEFKNIIDIVVACFSYTLDFYNNNPLPERN